MHIQYQCPVDGCEKSFLTAEELRGHMAGTMQKQDDHLWENVPISHYDIEPAAVRVDDLTDF